MMVDTLEDMLNDEFVATGTHENGTVQGAQSTVSGRQIISLTLPDKNDINGLIALLSHNDTVRGMKSLKAAITKYLNHCRLAAEFWDDTEKSHAFVTGNKTQAQRDGLANRTPRGPQKSVAYRYFDGLSEVNLQKQCKWYDIEPTNYDDKSALINALVSKHAE